MENGTRPKRLLERSGVRAWISFVLLLLANTIKDDGFLAVGPALIEHLDIIVELGLVALGLSASKSETTKPEPRAFGLVPGKKAGEA